MSKSSSFNAQLLVSHIDSVVAGEEAVTGSWLCDQYFLQRNRHYKVEYDVM